MLKSAKKSMNRSTRSSSTSRAVSDTSTQLSRNIPELFRSQRLSAQAQQAQTPSSPNADPGTQMTGETMPSADRAHLLSLFDLEKVASDIKNTVTAAIADLRSDIQEAVHRIGDVEKTTQTHAAAIRQVQTTYDSQLPHLLDLHRHIEDLDNRGRRHNIRVRGVPENGDPGHLQQTICAIFNNLIDRPTDSPIEMERAHRALRPPPRDNEPPRDVVCCIVNFPLKEEILRKARERGRIIHNGSEIKLFQDLSQITLQNRRALRPLLELLRARNIQYRWKFPFALSASARGRSAILRTPEDIPMFCEQLDLPRVDLPEWYTFYFPQEPWLPISTTQSPKAQRQRSRKQRPEQSSPNTRSSRRDLYQRSPGSPSSPSTKRDRHAS